MAHGLLGNGVLYYSGGVFNGDGPDFRNFDNQPDAIGRVTVSPFAGGEGMFRRLTLGGSGWYGRHVLGPTFPVQATPGGLRYLAPQWMTGPAGAHARAARARHPHRLRRRAVDPVRDALRPARRRRSTSSSSSPRPTRRRRTRPADRAGHGHAGRARPPTARLWLWLAGDERMLPVPGLQLPARIDRRYRRAFEDGLMLAVRGEFLKEDLVNNQPTLGQSDARDHPCHLGHGGRQLLARLTSRASRSTTSSTCGAAPRRRSRRCARRACSSTSCCFASQVSL